MELGEWKTEDYIFEKRKLENQIKREQIIVDRTNIDIKEIYLKIDELNLIIDKSKQRIEDLTNQINWINGKLKENGG